MCECGTSKTGNYFAKVGGQLGDRFQSFGENMLSSAQKRFKSWTGLGDYKIVFNSLINPSGELPTSFRTNNRGLIIRHKEYLGDVVTSSASAGAFSITKFRINPGDVQVFPWLNPIALQHDQYRPRGIIFEFVSTASDTSTGVTLGSVIMTTLYDVTDSDPVSKADMLNRAYSSEAKMSDNMSHGLECDPDELPKSLFYTRPTGSTNTTQDIRDYDMANFYVATQGGNLPVNTIVGSLYVHYEFEFFKQVPIGGLPCKSALYSVFSTWTTAGSVAVDFSMPNRTFGAGRPLGMTFSGLRLTIPKSWAGATFMLMCSFESRNNAVTTGTPTAFTPVNCSTISNNFITQGTAGYWILTPAVSGTANAAAFTVIIRVGDNISSDAYIEWTTRLGNFPASTVAGSSSFIWEIMAVPSTYNSLQ